MNYGNGLIQFQEKSFCANGICNDVTICQITDEGEEKYYVPVDQDLNNSRGLVNTFDSKNSQLLISRLNSGIVETFYSSAQIVGLSKAFDVIPNSHGFMKC